MCDPKNTNISSESGPGPVKVQGCNYQKIMNELGLEPSYLVEHKEIIVERLYGAAVSIFKGNVQHLKDNFDTPSVVAINTCIHLASSVALLGSTPEALQKTKKYLSSNCKNLPFDATTVITVAVLAYILNEARQNQWKPDLTPFQSNPEKISGAKLAIDSSRVSIPPKPFIDNPLEYISVIENQMNLVNWMVGPIIQQILFG